MSKQELLGIWVMEAFRRGGVDTDRLARDHPSEFATMLADPAKLVPRDLNTLLDASAQLAGDPHLGLHMVQYVDATMMGTFGYLLSMAPTVERLFYFAETYYPTLYRGATVHFTMQDPRCTLEFRMAGDRGSSQRHINEWTLGFFAVMLIEKIGGGWLPARTEFTNPAPPESGELHFVFGPDISFNAPRTAIHFDAEILPRTLNSADKGLLATLTDQAEMLLRGLPQNIPLADSVRLQVLEKLERREAHASIIAQSLAMSRSTFKRRLAAEGLSFRQLREEVICGVASRALIDTEVEIGTIAAKLGYSELSAFDRAFKRMTGLSPTECRHRG